MRRIYYAAAAFITILRGKNHFFCDKDALMDWNDQLREALRSPDLDNPAIRYVLETISALKREI